MSGSETIFNMASANIRFGSGATREAAAEMTALGVRSVLVVTDRKIAGLQPVANLLQALTEEKIAYGLYRDVRVEPTDGAFKDAIAFAQERSYEGVIAIGGGSAIDTAKVANLYTCYPAEFLDYVNAPIGKAKPVPGPVKPLIAIPTTAGTGSETTGVAIFDLEEKHFKTGISSARLKPVLGILDPDNTRTLPPQVAASTGLDVLTHAIESYTAIPFDRRARPERPALRPPYQGANPVSDTWSLQALRMVADYLVRAVEDPSDDEARGMMLLAAAYAGIGFGNAGVHLAHAMSYPVSGMVRDFLPAGYPDDHPLVPHGMSVVVNAPAVFRFTARSCPERHLKAAEILGADISCAREEDAGKILADAIIAIMQRLDMPNGLSALGFSGNDTPALVAGTLHQERITKLSPLPATEEDFAALFADAMRYW